MAEAIWEVARTVELQEGVNLDIGAAPGDEDMIREMLKGRL